MKSIEEIIPSQSEGEIPQVIISLKTLVSSFKKWRNLFICPISLACEERTDNICGSTLYVTILLLLIKLLSVHNAVSYKENDSL